MIDLARRVQALAQRHPDAADATLALAFAVAALVSITTTYEDLRAHDPSFQEPSTVATVVAMAGISLPLAWRRRFPFTAAGVVLVSFLAARTVLDVSEDSVTTLAAGVAIYSVAVHGRARYRSWVLLVGLAAILVQVGREVFLTPMHHHLARLMQSFELGYNVVILTLPWMLGAAMRSLRQRQHDLAERAVELQLERDTNARRAVLGERVRIARELHDVVAHHVSVMGVQAGAARTVMGRHPEQAAAALSSIESSSREAVVELHRLLGFLRGSDDIDELGPQPDLGQLGDLVAQVTPDDLTVDLSIEGVPRPLAPSLEVSAYRVIQEALTNTRKHSGGTSASVRVRYGTSTLEVEVLDDGPGRPGQPRPGGHGLIGMRERASLHGGHLDAGLRPIRGYAVRATFPLNGTAP